MPQTSLTAHDEERILEHGIGVMKDIFAQLSSIYDQLRIKVLSMIAAQLVLLGFVFTDWDLSKVHYSVGAWVIFGIAVLLQAAPLAIMMWVLSPIEWSIPGDSGLYKDVKQKYDNYIEYLNVVHAEFATCVDKITKPISKRSKAFNFVLYTLSLSIIVLLVLKNGG